MKEKYLDESLPVKERAKDLVSRMTLEEKASQLRYDAPAIDRLGIPAYNWWNEALHGVARAGTATVFPQAIGMAAMFDDEGLKEIADIISTEARASGQNAKKWLQLPQICAKPLAFLQRLWYNNRERQKGRRKSFLFRILTTHVSD